MLTKVVHLGTDAEYWYSLPPDKAVVAAYEQHSLGNFNWLKYPKPEDHPAYRLNKRTHSCGDFTALMTVSQSDNFVVKAFSGGRLIVTTEAHTKVEAIVLAHQLADMHNCRANVYEPNSDIHCYEYVAPQDPRDGVEL
jgi:hypothetical protein